MRDQKSKVAITLLFVMLLSLFSGVFVFAQEAAAPEKIESVSVLKQKMPEALTKTYFILENWQWLGILFVILVGMIIDRIAAHIAKNIIIEWDKKIHYDIGEDACKSTGRPVGLFVMSLFWVWAFNWLALPGKFLSVAMVAIKFLLTLASVWFLYSIVDIVCAIIAKKAEKTRTKIDDLLVPMVRKSLKIFVIVFGTVFIIDNLEIVEIKTLLTGLGLGGLAFALAAKDTVENIFGTFTILIDRPFNIGDWVIIKEANAEGSVYELGFRSTKVQTFYNSIITVPNSRLIKATVDNMGARTYRRIKTMISITYSTPPEKIDAFCEGIRELIRMHPYTRKDYFHVYFNAYSASSLDILLYCFLKTPDWSTELREKHRLFVDIKKLAKRLGVEFAYPTQTLYMHKVDEVPETESFESVDAALEAGLANAKEIVKDSLGDPPKTPPPVTF